MHILIMPSWYKSSPGEVLGSFFEEQARALQKNGHQVGIQFQIFYPASEIFKKRKAQPGYINDNGLPTFIYKVQGIIPRSRKFNDAYETFFSERIFRKYVKKFGMPDIIAQTGGNKGITFVENSFSSKKNSTPARAGVF